MLGIQIPLVELKHLIPNFCVFQSLTCSQLLQGTPGSLMKVLLIFPIMIFNFIEEIRVRRREGKVQVCWWNVKEMNRAGSFLPIGGFSPEIEDPITCIPQAALSSGFQRQLRQQKGWQQKGMMQDRQGRSCCQQSCCQHWGAKLWGVTASSAAEPRGSGLPLPPPSRGILMARCPSWNEVLIMEWITNSNPKGGDKTTLQDTFFKKSSS